MKNTAPLLVTALIIGLAAAFGTYMLVNDAPKGGQDNQLDRIEKRLTRIEEQMKGMK